MRTDLISMSEYCSRCNIAPSFLLLLEEEGLIRILHSENEAYLSPIQLQEVERYTRLHNELEINVAGLDAIHHLLNRMNRLQSEVGHLRARLSIYQHILPERVEEQR